MNLPQTASEPGADKDFRAIPNGSEGAYGADVGQGSLPVIPHLAMAFAISHPAVTTALLGARTMEHLDDLLAGLDVALSDDILDRIDEIVPPGTDIGVLDQAYVPPTIAQTGLRRRPVGERSAA